MQFTRRQFVKQAAIVTLGPGLVAPLAGITRADNDRPCPPIIDTHQHLWDLETVRPPWLAQAPEVLRRKYGTEEYLAATRGLNVQAIYMEVDVDPAQHRTEAEQVVRLCRRPGQPTIAAVVGGRPAAPDFADYVDWLKGMPEVKGVRQVLHGAGTPPGYCLQEEFVRGVRLLGRQGLRFDLCLRPAELGDALRLARQCPDTRLIVDHCGNADPKAFQPKASEGEQPGHDAAAWRREIDGLAQQSHVCCKISGIVARAPQGWRPEHLAPIVNHCLDAFGPDRVVFGGDWPVCLRGASLRAWIDALGEIIAPRPADQQTKLWSANARQIYGLDG